MKIQISSLKVRKRILKIILDISFKMNIGGHKICY